MISTPNNPISRARIRGWGIALPDDVITNADLQARLDTTDEWIVERTGIRERRKASASESTASLATEAATKAIKSAGLSPADIDLLIVATATPEQLIPHTGAHVGESLGLACGSFDLNAACAGFVYASVVGSALLNTGMSNVLVVGAETLSRIVDQHDRGTAVLFGDGAGAAVWSLGDPDYGLLSFDLGCDGSAADILQIPAGGSRLPTSAETVANNDHVVKMQGQEVFKRAVRAIGESAIATLANANTTIDAVDWFVPHQANIRIIETAANRIGIPMERVIVNIDKYGNTSTASIPLALFEAVESGQIKHGDSLLVAGFGAGMTWASALIRWGN